MALHGFNYRIRWTQNFTGLNTRPFGVDEDAETVAPVDLTRELKGYKTDADTYKIKPRTIDVLVRMSKKKSWYVKGTETDALLLHEQMHYNISALAGRDLERKLLALECDTPEELTAAIETTTVDMQTLLDSVNLDYDSDKPWGTNHGKKTGQQEFWNIHIRAMMANPEAELMSIMPQMAR